MITEDTEGTLPVHYVGQLCEINAFSEIAGEYNLRVIWDAHNAIGLGWNDDIITK